MTYREIQDILRKKGITQREIAKRAGVTEVSISQFLRRRFKSRKLSAVMEKVLGREM